MNLHDFSEDEAEEILARARERRDLIEQERQSRIFRGELEATDADGVQTMANYDKFW